MVIDVLLNNIATCLRTALSVNSSYIEVMPDKYPKPSMGKWFIAVHGGKFKKTHEQSYCIRGSLIVHLSMVHRTTPVPFDRQGTDLTAKATTGMIAIFENAIAALDGNAATVITTTNTTLGYKGIESIPTLLEADMEAHQIRGGGPLGWLKAENMERAGFLMEAKFKVYINRQRS